MRSLDRCFVAAAVCSLASSVFYGPAPAFASGAILTSGKSSTALMPTSTADICNYYVLGNGNVTPIPAPAQFAQYEPAAWMWSAVGVRSAPGDDWDIELYDSSTTAPNCVASLLAVSNATSGVDFIVGDYNRNPIGSEFPRISRWAGTQDAVAEWDWHSPVLRANNGDEWITTGPLDILTTWTVWLEAGHEYDIHFDPGGLSGLSLCLFQSQGATYWANRGSAVLTATGTVTYTAPATGWFGLVVVNDTGEAGTYAIGLHECSPPQPLTSGSGELTEGVLRFFSIDQEHNYWTAVAVRGSLTDWDIEVYDGSSGGGWPYCLDGYLAGSYGYSPYTDFVVGNFNVGARPLGQEFIRCVQASGQSATRTEWDTGPYLLVVDAPPVVRTSGGTEILDIWDVWLQAGWTHYFFLDSDEAPNIKLFLFQDLGPPHWFSRGDRVLEAADGSTPFTPVETGFYGVVVLNENGAYATYSLGVFTSPSAVAPPSAPPLATSLHPPAPNPATGAVNIRFSLAEPGPARLEVFDLSGRTVWRDGRTTWPAGELVVTWDGADRTGSRVAPGVYFVRMLAAGRAVGIERIVLLR